MNKKATLLTLVIAFFFSYAQGQVSLDSTDFAKIGDTLYMATDTIPPTGLSLGSAGTGQVWDFTALVPDKIDTMMFEDPASSIYDSIFPSANLTINPLSIKLSALAAFGLGEIGIMAYVKNSAAGFEMVGGGTDGAGGIPPTPVAFSPTQKWFNFPSVYLSTMQDTSGFDLKIDDTMTGFYDSLRVKRSGTILSAIDASGTITTPLGTFPCIREYKIEYTLDSIATMDTTGTWNFQNPIVAQILGSNPIADTIYSYNFYTDTMGFNIASVTVDTNNNILSVSYLTDCAILSTISVTPDSGNGDGTATVNVFGGTTPFTYLWSNGATTATADSLAIGGYSVTVTDANNCTTTASDSIVLGINSINNRADQISIYPNPAIDELKIVSYVHEALFFNIYNIIGEKITSFKLKEGTNVANISDLAKGVYVYQITDMAGETVKNGKITVAK